MLLEVVLAHHLNDDDEDENVLLFKNEKKETVLTRFLSYIAAITAAIITVFVVVQKLRFF